MTINQATVSGKWLEIKGEIQKAWGKLTSDELEQTKGDITAIQGLVLQKCGVEKEKFQTKFTEIVQRFEAKKESVLHNIKQNLKS